MRKQIYELDLADLSRYPVWAYALDEQTAEGQDEYTVRPYKGSGSINPSKGPYAVKTEFILADGTVRTGYLTPHINREADVSAIQPVIVTEHGQVMLWYGAFAPGDHILAEYYRRLGKNCADVFPITFRSVVRIIGGEISGVVSGFSFLNFDKTRRFASGAAGPFTAIYGEAM